MAFSRVKLSADTDDVIARWYNLRGEETSLQVSAGFEHETAYDSDVLERRRELLSERHDAIGAYKIVTRAYVTQ